LLPLRDTGFSVRKAGEGFDKIQVDTQQEFAVCCLTLMETSTLGPDFYKKIKNK
jgi:hypothetical protein